MLATAASLATGSAGVAPLAAQELPSRVASELVDRAMRQRIEVPVGRPVDSAWTQFPEALAWFTIALSLVMLIVGRNRVGGSHAPVVAVAPRTKRGQTGTGTRRESSAGRSPHVPVRSLTAPRETLSLPPHVMEILERSAARGHAEAHAATALDYDSTVESDGAGIDDEPGTGLDFVVPAYDPWKGQEPRPQSSRLGTSGRT